MMILFNVYWVIQPSDTHSTHSLYIFLLYVHFLFLLFLGMFVNVLIEMYENDQ